MPISRTIVAVFILLTCLFSCKNEDSIQQAESCDYLGSSYETDNTNIKYGRSTNIVLGSDGKLEEATAVNTFSGYDMAAQKETSNSVEQSKYVFAYDATGFLTKMISIQTFTEKSTIAATYDNHGPYKNINIETVQTTNFTYESGRVTGSNISVIKTLKGDNDAPFTTNKQSKKVYQYDSKGQPISATETSDSGNRIETKFTNGVRSSIANISTSGGAQTTTYNEKGLTDVVNTSSGRIKISYDSSGNPLLIETEMNGKVTYSQKFEYDNHVNPETLIPTKFKGIPEPIFTVQSTDGNNNIVRLTSANLQNNFLSKESVTYAYNSQGLPVKSVWTTDSDPNFKGRVTTFNYRDCE